MMQLEGIYAPVPTPFYGDESLHLDAFQENLEKWERSPIDGVVVCGSNGELPFLNPHERALLTRTAKSVFEKKRSGKRIVSGTYMNTTQDTITCCKACGDSGADAVLLLPPHYFKGQGMKAAAAFYERVADASPVPVVLYNMPGNTGVNLDASAILQVAAHPNIIGIKDTSGDMAKLCHLIFESPADFSVFSGSANYFLPALALGAKGGTLAAANLYPVACRTLYDLYRENRKEEAQALQHRLLLASEAVTGKFGIPGLKAAMDRAGLFGGPVRSPLLPLTSEEEAKLFAILDAADLDAGETWR